MIKPKHFKEAGISTSERIEIKEAIDALIEVGMPEEKATKKVLKDALQEAEKEHLKITDFIKQNGG